MSQDRPTKTINIQSKLHQSLKVVAAQEGKTVQQLAEEIFREALGMDE